MTRSKNKKMAFFSTIFMMLVGFFFLMGSPVFGQTGPDSEYSFGRPKIQGPFKPAQKRIKKRAGFSQILPFLRIPDLTDSQKAKIKALNIKYGKLDLPLKNQLGEKMAHLRTVSTADKVSLNEIYSIIDDIGALKIKIMKNRAALTQKVRALLTDEQRLMMDSRPMKHHRKQERSGKPF